MSQVHQQVETAVGLSDKLEVASWFVNFRLKHDQLNHEDRKHQRKEVASIELVLVNISRVTCTNHTLVSHWELCIAWAGWRYLINLSQTKLSKLFIVFKYRKLVKHGCGEVESAVYKQICAKDGDHAPLLLSLLLRFFHLYSFPKLS